MGCLDTYFPRTPASVQPCRKRGTQEIKGKDAIHHVSGNCVCPPVLFALWLCPSRRCGGLSENNAISPTLTLIERDVYGRGKDCYFFVFVSGLVSSISWFVLFVFIYSTVKEEDERKEMIKKNWKKLTKNTPTITMF